jgi:hypothetical protein
VTLAAEALLEEEKVPPVADHEIALADVSLATVAETERVCVKAKAARLGEIEMLTALEEIVRPSLVDLLCWGVPESTTSNVRSVPVTACVGVPLIVPVEAVSMRPAGSVPLVRDHV